MPFLALAHLRAARCASCAAVLAEPAARSFVVGASGEPVFFSAEDPPQELTVALACPNGHELVLTVPGDVAAEEAARVPDDAPLGADAVLRAGRTQTGVPL